MAMVVASCETTQDDGPVSDWHAAPLVHVDDGKTRALGPTALGPSKGGTASGNITNITGTGLLVGESAPAAPRKSVASEDGIVLNIANLPIAQAAKVVLGDILSVNYVIDPKVDGKITVHTTNPVPKADLIALFESALRVSNAAVVQSGDLYKIVPLDQAVSTGSRLKAGDGGPVAEAIGSGLQVVQLRFVSASEMKRVLDPIAPKGGVVRADDSRNVLTLSGTAEEIGSMMDAITVFDVDTMKGMSFGIVPVRTSDPDAIAEELRNVFETNKDGPMGGMVRFVANKNLGSILVISSQPRYIARAEDWIRRLDAHAQESEKQLFTYPVQNRSAKELVDILNGMFSKDATSASKANNVAPHNTATTITSSLSSVGASQASPFGSLSATSFQSGSAQQSVGAGTTTTAATPQVTPVSTNAQEVGRDTAGSSLVGDDSRVKISADDSNNAVIVMATAEDYKRIHRVIESLDVVPNQVLIEASIAEVTLTDDMQFGVRWYLQNKPNTSSATFSNDAGGAVSSVFPGFSYALKAANAQATLNALNAVTTVNVISSPSLMVLDNKTATLQVGDEVPITTQTSESVVTTDAPVVSTVSYVNTGVILSITPRISESGRVLLDIEQEVSSVVQTTSSSINSPTIQQRKIKTTVVLNDSEALTLGGLIQNQKTVTKNQVPLLGDIPVIGSAFKDKDDLINKTELIIIITPRVVRNLNEAQAVTDEYRRKLNVYVPRASGGPRTFEQNVQRMLQ